MKVYLGFGPARHGPLNGDWVVPGLRLRPGTTHFYFVSCRAIPVKARAQPGSARVCASRPLRYVSVINDNHLVSLINFNAAKVD
jgi:hypothetical protein